jgi:hypothetical protein
MRTLSADGQIAPVPVSAVRADFDEPLDVHRSVLAQVAFDSTFGLNGLTNAVHFFLAEVLNFLLGRYVCLVE